VTQGSFLFQLEGQEARVLEPGHGFFEPAGQTVLQFDNLSSTEPVEIVCFYLKGNDDGPLIEMLNGGTEKQLGSS
jgi:quercetin dioxygenase-like cupin family protein